MKALILAAGLGSRLVPITDTVPKSLVPVNGKPILFKQIENLQECGIDDVTIVSGYLSHVLEERTAKEYPWVRFVENVDYATTNNMYSAYLGIKELLGHDVIMMNADVFYDASVLHALVGSKSENAIVVDMDRYLEESMKVTYAEGRIQHISKKITEEDALGTSIDVYRFSPEGARDFFDVCKDYIETRKELCLWSEVALDGVFDRIAFQPCSLEGRWFEIDNHDDLAAAEVLFATEA